VRKVELLIKPVSYKCNLSCRYCFYKKTRELYPERPHRMDDKVLEKLISEAIDYSEGGICIFSWQGGEPLLAGIDFFQKVIELQKSYGKPGQVISNSFQTNATMLTDKWTKLFREYNFLVGVSLDGPEDVHNFYRVFPSKKGSFRKVMEGISLLKKERVEFNILSTIGKDTAKYVQKIYKFFLRKNLFYLQFIPAVDRRGEKMADFSIKPDQYGKFLCDLFDLWWNKGEPFSSIRFFDNILEILLQGKSSSCMFKEECGEYIVVESNGDVYPCDFFVRKEWKLGNILETPLGELFRKAKSQFGKLKKISPRECRNCKWNFICHNGCLWFRWVKNGKIDEKDYLCEAYKKFFSYTLERFEKLRDSILLGKSIQKNLEQI